jgi:hypothetical protein
VFDECSKIANIFGKAALSGEAFALAVTSSIVRNDSEGACQPGNDGIPGVVVYPGAVNEDKWIASLSSALPIESNAVEKARRHHQPPLRECSHRCTRPLGSINYFPVQK